MKNAVPIELKPEKCTENLSLATTPFFCYLILMNPDLHLLQREAYKLGVKLDRLRLAQFDIYQKELRKWNDKTNLISGTTSGEIITRHFLDSLTAVQFIGQENARIIDIGSGAGFPGIPLKIALPSLQLYLLEANRKKISFLKHLVRLLNLTNTFALQERVENLLADSRWKYFFTIVISRATLKLPELLPLSAFFLEPGGKLIALKSRNIEKEFREASAIAASNRFSQLFQYDINMEVSGIPRKIIVGEKLK
jgi:16S rRNA (guanine527-N7)-methyltransferase